MSVGAVSVAGIEANYINAPTTRQVVVDYAQVVALYMQKPLHFATQPILRSVGTAIHPGKGDNLNSYTLEVIRRVFAFIFGVLVGLATLPLWIPGLILDKVSQWSQNVPFTHWRGNAPEKTDYANPKFMTQNTCSLWGGLPYLFGGVRPPTQRTQEMAAKIKEADPDVVVMQEMSFDPSHSLYHALKDRYAHFFTRISPNVPLMESALCVASKYPILDAGFILFPDQTKMHRGSFWIETPKCFVFTTHLEYGHDDAAREKRATQLKMIREKMEEFGKKKPCYLLGDLNLDRRDAEYAAQIPGKFHDPSLLKYPTLTEKTATCTDRLSHEVAGQPLPKRTWEYIDYALSLREFECDLAHVQMYDTQKPYQAISDHRGVTAEIVG